ncbi:monoacylglycerol lipase ABHD12-like, partial [Brachionus plicatilis]
MSFLLGTIKFIFYSYFLLYAFLHVVIYTYPQLASFVVFQNTIKWPFSNLSHPIHYGLKNVHNFYFKTGDENKIGVWHYIPQDHSYDHAKHASRSNAAHFKAYLSAQNKNPIFIYAHGNDRDRASPYRIELCTNLVKLGVHVFALDYRGYGDSTGSPTELGAVSDVLDLYKL